MGAVHPSFLSFCSRAWPSLIMIRGFGGPKPHVQCSLNSLRCLGATSGGGGNLSGENGGSHSRKAEHRIKQVFRRLIVPHHARPRRKVLNLRYELDLFCMDKPVRKRGDSLMRKLADLIE